MPITYRVPTKTAELLPPKASSLITEAATFQRTHWEELSPFWQAISGEADSIHGSLAFDEAACAFKAKEIAALNGYAFLGKLPTAQFWQAMRFGFRRNTGLTVGKLKAQNKQLRLEL